MKTWRQKFENGKQPIVKRLDIAYGGMGPGDNMLISTPAEIDEYIRAIPRGTTVTIEQMRKDLAAVHRADGTCPLTTGIFTRIVAECALEDLAVGKAAAPFWRVVDPASQLARKVSCGPEAIADMRGQEA